MISGEVTADNEAVVFIRVSAPNGAVTIRAVIDTGFTEFLTLPPDLVDSLALLFDSDVTMYLAGDTPADFELYQASVDWDGTSREVIAVKADGDALIGMRLLRGSRTTLDCIDGGSVTIVNL